MAFRHSIVQATAIAGIGLIAISSPAGAQAIGTYSGMTADGHAVTIVVGQDPNNSNLAITQFEIQFDAHCPISGLEFRQGENFGLLNDIIDRKATFTFDTVGLYSANTFLFHGKTGLTGTTQVRVPAIVDGNPPKRAELCVSPRQGFSATRQ